MGRPNRSDVVSSDEVGVYHCYSRCHNGAFLCGYDKQTGQDYEHRRDWIEERQELLAACFAIELLAHIIMSNHMHHVTRTRPDLVKQWSDEEVVRRWLRLHPPRSEGKVLEVTDDMIAARAKDKDLVAQWRARLGSLSWYMKELKEHVAKRANEESQRTGAFFDSRFKSPRLPDVVTVLVCMMYVDLNAVRAKIVERLEQYKHGSYYRRSLAHQLRQAGGDLGDDQVAPDAFLQPLPEEGEPANRSAPQHRPSDKGILPMSVVHYLALVDWLGRSQREDKRGKIPEDLAPILDRLGGSEELMVSSPVLYDEIYRRSAAQICLPGYTSNNVAA